MVKVKFLGHACVLLEGSYRIIIDPYIEENPSNDLKLSDIPPVDLILVTHGHQDHLGDAVALSERDDAQILAIFELAEYLSSQGAKAIGMNFGGTFDFNGIKISLVPAVHSSSVIADRIIYTGNPAGFVIEMDYRRFYHAGDTMLYSDMQLIPEIFGPIDVSFLPIGGLYTMDVRQAAIAAVYTRSRIVVPIHYNTWEGIVADPEELKKLLEDKGIEVKILKPGESFEI